MQILLTVVGAAFSFKKKYRHMAPYFIHITEIFLIFPGSLTANDLVRSGNDVHWQWSLPCPPKAQFKPSSEEYSAARRDNAQICAKLTGGRSSYDAP